MQPVTPAGRLRLAGSLLTLGLENRLKSDVKNRPLISTSMKLKVPMQQFEQM